MTRLQLLSALALAFALGACRRSDPGRVSKEEAQALLERYEKAKRKEAERSARERTEPLASGATSAPAGVDKRQPGGEGSNSGSDEPTPAKTAPAASGGKPAPPTPEAARKARPPFTADEPVPIAPAGPAKATARGVVMVNRAGEALLAKLGALPGGRTPRETPVTAIRKSAAPFPLGRAPAVIGKDAYWVSDGRLVRRKIAAGAAKDPIEVLASDAQNGTRVAEPIGEGPVARPSVAYVVRPEKEDAPLRARLWVEGAGAPALLTPEGSSTHGVALLATSDGLIAFSLQARMAMTPIHARRIRVEKAGPVLGEDIVVWVGGGVQPMTELAIARGKGGAVWGFIPHERSITEFGLAVLDIGAEPDMDTPTSWIRYPNGIDPAPVATGTLCGDPLVVYAQPENGNPDARQELIVRAMPAAAAPRFQAIATAKAFFDVSAAAIPGGALVAYVADWVTWAVTVRCDRA